jgi:RNA polymerase sigma-70 factor (ECF subfamily)
VSDPTADQALIDALRRGDEAAFVGLVEKLHRPLIRTAIRYVRDPDVAEEVVQEAWIAVVTGIDRFESRSSLRTWIFQIATFKARTRGQRERRFVELSSMPDSDTGTPSVDPDRFVASGRWTGHWASAPATWGADGEALLLSAEVRDVIERAMAGLTERQRTVMNLRDFDGMGSDEVSAILTISPGNQRVLLHRARSRVRAALETYIEAASQV